MHKVLILIHVFAEILDYQTSRLQASRLRIALFNLLQSDNAKTRQSTLQKIFKLVHSYAIISHNSSSNAAGLENIDLENLKISGSPETADDDPSTAIPTVDHSLEAEGAAEQLHLYLLTLLRLATTCPYSDVRRRCTAFLNQLQVSCGSSMDDLFGNEQTRPLQQLYNLLN